MDVSTALETLYKKHGSWGRAAKAAGINYSTLYAWTEKGGGHEPTRHSKDKLIRAARRAILPPIPRRVRAPEDDVDEDKVLEITTDALIFSITALDAEIERLENVIKEAKESRDKIHSHISKISGELNK